MVYLSVVVLWILAVGHAAAFQCAYHHTTQTQKPASMALEHGYEECSTHCVSAYVTLNKISIHLQGQRKTVGRDDKHRRLVQLQLGCSDKRRALLSQPCEMRPKQPDDDEVGSCALSVLRFEFGSTDNALRAAYVCCCNKDSCTDERAADRGGYNAMQRWREKLFMDSHSASKPCLIAPIRLEWEYSLKDHTASVLVAALSLTTWVIFMVTMATASTTNCWKHVPAIIVTVLSLIIWSSFTVMVTMGAVSDFLDYAPAVFVAVVTFVTWMLFVAGIAATEVHIWQTTKVAQIVNPWYEGNEKEIAEKMDVMTAPILATCEAMKAKGDMQLDETILKANFCNAENDRKGKRKKDSDNKKTENEDQRQIVA